VKNKEQLRALLDQKRSAVGESERQKAAQLATHSFEKSDLFITSQHIACYLPRTVEFDCTPMIQTIWEAKKSCYIPILVSEDAGLQFAHYQVETPVILNRYKILEPESAHIFSALKLDVVILPLVGFDDEGNRLGMGGGYYDRTFAFLRNNTVKKPVLIGLGYECQRVRLLPHDEWDIKLDGMLTEKGLHFYPHKSKTP